MTGEQRSPSDSMRLPGEHSSTAQTLQSTLQTEFEFTLPRGYVDDEGTCHTEGQMRLASAADEIKPLTDPRVQSNESYLTVILLSRVVMSLGTLPEVTPAVVEDLFVSDLAYLQDLYERINARTANAVDAVCPECGENFAVAVSPETSSAADSAATSELKTGNSEG